MSAVEPLATERPDPTLSRRPDSPPSRPSARRPALDGLRALAVAVVAVYHFGGGSESWLPGGYLGVDVFFVLSGYLITGLLLAEYDRRGRIDLVAFWVRRVRRLAPALLVLLLVVAAWIWWATPPNDYPRRRADIFWTLGYAANWHLVRTSETYFAAYATASPLRHAWSLAVEEQFYLVWPPLLLAVVWLGRRLARSVRPRGLGARAPLLVVIVAGIALSALWMAGAYSPLYPSTAYYSTQGRVQELFVGALLAVAMPGLLRRASDRDGGGSTVARVITAAAVTGLGLLLAAICWLPDDTALFYRGGALVVCLSVALVVAGVELLPGGAMARVFGWRPAVALGRISYGVYLWHWPVLVAIPSDAGMPMSQQVQCQTLRVLVTLAAATASYVLVEQPVQRSRVVLRSTRRVVAALLVTATAVVAVTLPATALPGTLAQQMSGSSDRACPGESLDVLRTCVWPAGDSGERRPVGLALLGDSTGRALAPGLDDWADRSGSSWVEAAWKICTVTGLLVVSPRTLTPQLSARVCSEQAPGLVAGALQRYRPPVVLVAEYWMHSQPFLIDGKLVEPGTPEHASALRAGYLELVDSVAAYGGRIVFLELPPPGNQLGTVVATGRPAGRAYSPVFGNGRYVEPYNAVLRSVARSRPDSASTVSITDAVCPDGRCSPVTTDGMLIRYDGVHYTIPFSRRVVPVLMERLGLPA